MIQDQVLYNKVLRADWKKRETTVLTLLRDIVASEPSMFKRSFFDTISPCYNPPRVCALINPSSRMPRGSFIHPTELGFIIGGPYHFVQGKFFYLFLSTLSMPTTIPLAAV